MFDPDMERVDITVMGRVQGVAFLWHTVQEAVRLDLVGWVRNLPDGSVRMVAEGRRDKLEMLLVWAAKGPDRAHVVTCLHTWQQPTGGFDDFLVTG